MINSKQRNQPLLSVIRKKPILLAILLFFLLAGVVLLILWQTGVFRSSASYLPKRDYILAPDGKPNPQTLDQLLHIHDPGVEDLAEMLLQEEDLARELLAAGNIEELISSRLSLNNLREINAGLQEKLTEISAEGYVAGVATNKAEDLFDFSEGGPNDHGPTDKEFIDKRISLISELLDATEHLLEPPAPPTELHSMGTDVNIKTTWQDPGQCLIHLTPSGGWLPDEGYQLYRSVAGKKELIVQGLANPEPGLTGALILPDLVTEGENIIPLLYMQAALTSDKLKVLEMTAAEFDDFVYRVDSLQPKSRINGQKDFWAVRAMLITIASKQEQKIPETDYLLDRPVLMQGWTGNSSYNKAAAVSAARKKFALVQAEQISGAEFFLDLPNGAIKYELANEILNARQQLLTLSFVNDEFARAAGFMYEDDLTALDLPDGTEISYSIEAGNGSQAVSTVSTGSVLRLSKPGGLEGYGLDSLVSLRWEAAESEAERKILSGYHIERKVKGESNFTRVNKEPVSISHILDEIDIYFESPIFFEDELDDGKTAEYRICSIDVYGRLSEYSDPVSIKVEKVTPPDAPGLDPPLLHLEGEETKLEDETGEKLTKDPSVN